MLCILLLLLLTSLSFPVVNASEKTDFRVNDDIGSAEQNDPRITVAGDGSSVIVWVDQRHTSKDIYLQRFDPEGEPIGTNLRVNDDTLMAFQATPSVGSDLSGLYRVVWQDYRNGYPLKPGIFYQSYDSSLFPFPTDLNLTSAAIDQQRESPDIAIATDGTGIVVWADYRNQNWDIYGQRLNSDGSLSGPNFRVNDADIAAQHSPRVSMGPQGWFVVCWYDNRSGNDDVYVQPYNAGGTKIGSVLKINNDAGVERQVFPDVAADGLGRFTVVWVDYRNGRYPSNPDIYAAKLDTNGVYLSSNIKLNTDETTAAQKYPSISADRMGNVAIIWSDSTLTSWDIMGQMIDVNGLVREVNFQANSSSDSAQFKADVALDGKFRYITWVDSREDRLFDIYASITQYNERSLIIQPPSLVFEMVRGEGLPVTQTIAVDHTGYNAVSYNLSFSANWMTAVSNTGITPDTITVNITDSNLLKGTYLTDITLIDPLTPDSLFVIPVRLEVTTPTIALSSDTCRFVVPEGVDREYVQTVEITNSGAGELAWMAQGGESWLNLSKTSGQAPDVIDFTANGFGLTAGNYTSTVQIVSDNADNSPDTIIAILDVRDDLPTVEVAPDSIVIRTGIPELVDRLVVISNGSQGTLNWSATTDSLWVVMDQWAGNNNNDTIHLQLDGQLLEVGNYVSTLYFVDSLSINIVDSVLIDVTIVEGETDTIRIEPIQLSTNEVSLIPITFVAVSNINRLFLPLTYDAQYLTVDSLLPLINIPDWMNYELQVDGLSSELFIALNSTNRDSSLVPGVYSLAVIAVTTLGEDGTTTFQPALYDSIRPYLVTDAGLTLAPKLQLDTVRIGNPTDIDEVIVSQLPTHFELYQNYPNPFNAGTVISFEISEQALIKLVIFDLLGREIATFSERRYGAGRHTVDWDGRIDQGGEAPSGMYFYRMNAHVLSGGRVYSLSRKMLLLK